ncbi:HlyD family secretion protein [Chloroflexota bacterium]
MKRRGIIGIMLLGLILMGATACGGGDEETTETIINDINVTVTGDGNIEASLQMGLTFGSGGKIDKIYVKEGDRVSQGDVLARLDTGDTGALKLAEAQAQIALTQAQLALTEQELAVPQAEINVKNAEMALEEAEDAWLETLSVGRKVLRLEQLLERYLSDDPGEVENISEIKQELKWRWNEFFSVASDSDEVTIKELELELAKESVEHAQQAVNLAQQAVNLAQQAVNLAQESLDQARKDQEEAAAIIAPFDGMVSKIGAKEGEFLSPAAYTGTTIVEIIDLRNMELTARVDELDIVKVKIGQKAMISVDAMPETMLEGQVIFISLVAREPGVVLFESDDEEEDYEVKIDFDIPEDSPIRVGMSATAKIIVE